MSVNIPEVVPDSSQPNKISAVHMHRRTSHHIFLVIHFSSYILFVIYFYISSYKLYLIYRHICFEYYRTDLLLGNNFAQKKNAAPKRTNYNLKDFLYYHFFYEIYTNALK